jgi:hypothetical protein
LTHHFSRPGFTGYGFRVHAAATTAILLFNRREEGFIIISDHSLIFSHALALSSGSNGLWGTGWRAFAVFGGRLGLLVRARFVPLVIALGSALSLSLLSFLARVSSHLISSRLVVLIPSLCSHFPRISFSRRPFQGVQKRERGAATLRICIGKEGTQNHTHVCSTTPSPYFPFSPF